MRIILPVVMFSLAISCSGEKDKKGRAAAELQTVPTSSFSLTSGDISSNVTIESIKIPIFAMVISGGDGGGGKMYDCGSSVSADCLVELVGTNLTDLLTGGSKAPEEIKAGTFDLVSVYHKPTGCNQPDEASKSAIDASATFRASGSIGGVTYYTNKATKLSTTGPAEDINFDFGACQSDSRLNGEIKEGETLLVKSFVDLQYLGTMTDIMANNGTFNSSLGVGMVLSSFNIVSTLDASSPKVERYLLAPAGSDAGCGGFMSLFFTPGDEPFGGFMRPYGYTGQDCTAGRLDIATGGELRLIQKNTDGTLNIRDTSADLPPGNLFPAFQRKTHEGQMQAKRNDGIDTLKDMTYQAQTF